METKEIIRALRCTASLWGGKDKKEVCKDCPYLHKEVPTGKLIQLANESDGMLWSCDCERIALDAADRLEELAAVPGNLPEQYAKACAVIDHITREWEKDRKRAKNCQWVSVDERLPETIQGNGGVNYSEALIVWTSGKKIVTAIFDGENFLGDFSVWEAEDEDILYWMQPPIPEQERRKNEK